jgi:hypothetical protein
MHVLFLIYRVHCIRSGCAMAQAVSLLSLTAKARIRARFSPCGVCYRQSGTVTYFSLRVLRFYTINIFHHGSTYSYITWGMNKKPVGGRSSETQFHPTDVNDFIISRKKYYKSRIYLERNVFDMCISTMNSINVT